MRSARAVFHGVSESHGCCFITAQTHPRAKLKHLKSGPVVVVVAVDESAA